MNIKTKNVLVIQAVTMLYVLVACSARTGLSSTPTGVADLPTIDTSAATWTPLPILSAEQAREKINTLNLNNGGCQLPCWWGIIPGKTTWFEAMHFLAAFSQIKQGENGSFFEDGKNHDTTYFEVYYDVPGEKESRRMLFSGQDGLVSGITVFSPDTEFNFKLDQMLKVFGKPEQVYISAQPDSQTNDLLPARILLDYSHIGIWASYEYPPSKVGETLRICPQPVGARLSLWDPKAKSSRRISIEEYVSRITGFEPRKLEDVSSMTIESFSKTFQNPISTTCLETQVSIWP